MKRYLSGWSRALRWPAAEWRLTAISAFAVPAASLTLRTFGFYRTWQRVAAIPARADITIDTKRAARAVGRVRRFGPYRGNCLSASIALMWLLRRHGCDAVLRLGTQVSPAGLAAHAWIELDGVVLNDSADVTTRYTPFADWRELSRAETAQLLRRDS